ncbi:hypothetical protein Tco_1091521 [Tanacetum coccineum]|uniref:Uncharacterized protein n=1 Tax=Tanacetum coccineum TaxID=301880 RepID=A0ABQ5I7A3_9ASTR
MHLPVRHQGIVEEPTHEDSPINHDVLHPSFNPVTGEPGSAQSSSRNVNSAKPNQVNQPPEEGNDPDLERAKKMSLEALQEKGEGEGDDADLERAIKLSLDPAFLPQGRAPVGGVTIIEPYQKQLPNCMKCDQTSLDSTTGPSSQPEDDTSEKVLERHTADLIKKYSCAAASESTQNQESKKSLKEIIRIKREQDKVKDHRESMIVMMRKTMINEGPPGWIKPGILISTHTVSSSEHEAFRSQMQFLSGSVSESSTICQDRKLVPSHTAVNMWIRNVVNRFVWGELTALEKKMLIQTKITLNVKLEAVDYYFKEDYTIVPKPRAVVYRDRNDQRKLMRLNELHKFSDRTLTRVAVSSSLRLLEPKCTIESKAKRSSLISIRTLTNTPVFTHYGNKSIPKSPMHILGIFKDGEGDEIPAAPQNIKMKTECSDTTYTCYEVMKDLIKVSKLPQTLTSSYSSTMHKWRSITRSYVKMVVTVSQSTKVDSLPHILAHSKKTNNHESSRFKDKDFRKL